MHIIKIEIKTDFTLGGISALHYNLQNKID